MLSPLALLPDVSMTTYPVAVLATTAMTCDEHLTTVNKQHIKDQNNLKSNLDEELTRLELRNSGVFSFTGVQSTIGISMEEPLSGHGKVSKSAEICGAVIYTTSNLYYILRV